MRPPPPLTLDVRPQILRQQSPLGSILAAVDRLRPGQSLRLIAPFETAPLYAVLGARGFAHAARAREDGSWEMLFTPETDAAPGPAEGT